MAGFFDPNSEYQTSRRNLPHWNQETVTYFVTFHLADSLPATKLAAFKEEKNRWLAVNRPPLSEAQLKEYHQTFSQRIQRWLDVGHGSCVLARPDVLRLVDGVLKFFSGERYLLGEHVVMPNHVHALVQPLADYSLPQILHSWKSFSANQINKIAGSRGAVWHQESFDRIVRSPDHLARIQAYIRDNPHALSPYFHPDIRG
jgi:REP element-mobilizing transposase RayT